MLKEIVYSGDPLCAWCFGFTDIFSNIRKTYKDDIRFTLIMGGLKVESSFTIDDSVKPLMQKNLATVAKRTGQIFSVDKIHELPEGSYNSEPPSRAVVAVRLLAPSHEYEFYKGLHQAFYQKMQNINDPVCLCAEAEKLGIDPKRFMAVFESNEAINQTRNDFYMSKKAGVLGYPALVLKDENGLKVLNQGYKPLNQLTRAIDRWIEGESVPFVY